jgi:hydrogenase expression/formation protein HypD
MKYIDEFRDKRLVRNAAEEIKKILPRENINIMEVCGTHTQNFFRFGLDKILPQNLRLISGPGCPVCVSPQSYIDQAVELGSLKENIILSFGDMLRVPGHKSTLEKERARGLASVRVVYSALDCLSIARQNPGKKVIFLAVGFETTAPTIALTIIAAKKQGLKNLFFFSSLKCIVPAMDYLVKDGRLNIKGFLCPGHVSAVIGTKPYEFIAKRYKIPCCITGFEPLDILEGIYILIKQIRQGDANVANQYLRVVRRNGNLKAKRIMFGVFKISDSYWRGFGRIPDSGLKIRAEFSRFDAEKVFPSKRRAQGVGCRTQCRCGDVLKGIINPKDCPLFAKICSPDNPLGPCMVSSEGACNAYYRYR